MLLSGGGSLGGMSHSANAGSVAGNHDNGDGLPRVPINDVVVCIEDTTVMGTTVDELFDTYLLPCLTSLNGGIPPSSNNKNGLHLWNSPSCSTTFTLVTFKNADCLPRSPVAYRGPFTNLNTFVEAFTNVRFMGGAGESQSWASEGLAMSLNVFDNLDALRERDSQVPKDHSKHIIFMANTTAYDIPVARVHKYADCTVDDLLQKISAQDVKLSVIAPRKIPFLLRMFQKAGGGDMIKKNYAKQATHFVVVSGDLNLGLEPSTMLNQSGTQPTPAVSQPGNLPMTNQQTNPIGMANTNVGMGGAQPANLPQRNPNEILRRVLDPGGNPAGVRPQGGQQVSNPAPITNQAQSPQQPSPKNAGKGPNKPQQSPAGVRPKGSGPQNRMPVPPQQPQQQRPMRPGVPIQLPQKDSDQQGNPTAPNVTIGNRLPHPGHPAPPQQQNPTLTGLLNNPPQGQAGMPQQQQPGNPMGQPQPGMPVMHGMQRPQMPGQLQPGQPQQRMPMGPQNPIWKGALQWTEKTNQQNAINRINCSVTPYQANPQAPIPIVNTSNWPENLMMQLVQTSIIKQIGQHFFKTAMTVLFQLEQGPTLQKLTTAFQQNQVTGVVHFKNENSAENPPQIMILLLMKKAPAGLQYIGFIPNDQKQFIENLKKAVANHKIQQQQQMQMQQMQQQQQQQQSSGQQMPTSSVGGPPGGMTITMGMAGMTGGTVTMAGGAGSHPQQQQWQQMGGGDQQQQPDSSGMAPSGVPIHMAGQQQGPGQPGPMRVGPRGVMHPQGAGLRQILQQQQQQGMMRPQQQMQQQMGQQQQNQNDPMLRELLG